MKYYSNGNRACATCANWGGEHTVKLNGSQVEVRDMNQRGPCYCRNHHAVSMGGEVSCFVCSNYQKWGALR